jgi:sugar lactone lactonase YvrE
VFIPSNWLIEGKSLHLALGDTTGSGASAWWNGQSLDVTDGDAPVPIAATISGDHNLIVVRVPKGAALLTNAPVVKTGENRLTLAGRWQFRIGPGDAGWENIPLPAKFGGAPDVVFAPEEPLWVARPLTRPGEFTPGIEGPGCDKDGNIFAVNYGKQGTIGRVTPRGAGEIFVELTNGSIGNGIRFDAAGNFFVADYTNHNVLRVDARSQAVTVLGHNSAMNQPNDIAMADDGTLYASDPNWKNSTGQLWRIDIDGTTTLLAKDLGTTNGLDVSPDGKTLYVNESNERNIWAFPIKQDRTLGDKRLISQFEDHGFDGMRVDVDGNLYVTRIGKGTVVKLTPGGEILQEIDVLGRRPSNLCFGGPDGCTVYVTEVEYTRLVSFRVDRPGREWREKAE